MVLTVSLVDHSVFLWTTTANNPSKNAMTCFAFPGSGTRVHKKRKKTLCYRQIVATGCRPTMLRDEHHLGWLVDLPLSARWTVVLYPGFPLARMDPWLLAQRARLARHYGLADKSCQGRTVQVEF